MSSHIPLDGTLRQHPRNAAAVGTPAPDQIIQVTLMLRRRAEAPTGEEIQSHLSHGQLTHLHGADPSDILAVEQFAAEQHLTIVDLNPAARSIKISGPLSVLAAAFKADLELHSIDGQTVRTRQGELAVPECLANRVTGIFGFDQRPVARTYHAIKPHTAESVSYTPRELAKIYNFPTTTGKNQTIALIELGGGFKSTDLKSYWKSLGVNAVNVSAVSVDGAQNSATGNADGPDGEVVLDIEVAGGIAPGANITVYFAPNTDAGFLDAINSAIHDLVRKPSVISISWGAAEKEWTPQSMNAFNAAFHDAALLGISVCVAAGDNGSSDGESDGLDHVDFPASSPWVLACGGTNLIASNGTIQSETVWNEGTDGGATGGGVSGHFSRPWYQNWTSLPVSTGSTALVGRGVPDVAGVADPNTGYQILVDGTNSVIGGTSAVAPLWAGLIALMNENLGKNLGFFHWTLYSAVKEQKALNDITSGTNGTFEAARGWDACTGLGSPNGQAILNVFKQLQK